MNSCINTWCPLAELCQLSLFSGRKSLELVSKSFRKELAGTSPCSAIYNETLLWSSLREGSGGRKEECLCCIKYFHYASDVEKFLVGLKHVWHNWLEDKQKTM